MTVAEYRKDPAINQSNLKKLWNNSPEKAKHEIETFVPTYDMELGTIYHLMVLDGSPIEKVAMLTPDCDRRSNANKLQWAAAEEAAEEAGLSLVKPQDAERLDAMKERLQIEPFDERRTIGDFLDNPNLQIERPFFSELHGKECKGLIDIYDPETNTVYDLKTCRDASPYGFAKDAEKLSYDIQAAFYFDLVTKVNGTPPDRFVFIAQEKEFPYSVGQYAVSEEGLSNGRILYEFLLGRWAEWEAKGWRGGYTDGAEELQTSAWRANQVSGIAGDDGEIKLSDDEEGGEG